MPRISRTPLLSLRNIIIAVVVITILLVLLNRPEEEKEDKCPVYIPNAPAPPLCAQKAPCKWEFQNYQISKFEKMWVDHKEDSTWVKSPCQRFHKDNNDKYSETWMKFTIPAMDSQPDVEPDSDVFSQLIYKKSCTGETKRVYIEPIALTLRNPFICDEFLDSQVTYEGVINKSYMLLDWEIGKQREDQNGKVYLFDIGSSLFSTGSGGASQAWFISQFESRGLSFDGIWSWEYEKHDAEKVFADIPERLWSIYHWYNIPVDASSKMANPWNIVQQIATPNDIVIVKLDIDTPKIEHRLIQQLVESPSLGNLVDVIFYEDHVDIVEMYTSFGKKGLGTYAHAIDAFVDLRKKGIRAHPWV